MKMKRHSILIIFLIASTALLSAADDGKKGKKGKGGKKDDWNKSEYSGDHTPKDIQMAMYSKGFAWLSGSPADNEKLSVGKTSQFFGFVAVRYDSGRVAQRGELGRAFYNLATVEQREILLEAVKAEDEPMKAWWENRSKILRLLEHHLYTGEDLPPEQIDTLSKEFGRLNAESAFYEARAFAEIEDSLTDDQWATLRAMREDPGLASGGEKNMKRNMGNGLSKEQYAQYEDLFAKAFTWLTGTMDDNKVVPLGQPAQFFGFVSIRHKSGHGASRGQISKQFADLLTSEQKGFINDAMKELIPATDRFMSVRNEFLLEMDKLRKDPSSYSGKRYKKLAEDLGVIEIECGIIEAQAYHKIRKSMSAEQNKQMMAIRSEYIIDSKTMETLNESQRGEALYNLCTTCHNNPQIAPQLNNTFGRPLASVSGYNYSEGLKRVAKDRRWTSSELNAFLQNPTKYAPGTKMGFQGLLSPDDRSALINHLKRLSSK